MCNVRQSRWSDSSSSSDNDELSPATWRDIALDIRATLGQCVRGARKAEREEWMDPGHHDCSEPAAETDKPSAGSSLRSSLFWPLHCHEEATVEPALECSTDKAAIEPVVECSRDEAAGEPTDCLKSRPVLPSAESAEQSSCSTTGQDSPLDATYLLPCATPLPPLLSLAAAAVTSAGCSDYAALAMLPIELIELLLREHVRPLPAPEDLAVLISDGITCLDLSDGWPTTDVDPTPVVMRAAASLTTLRLGNCRLKEGVLVSWMPSLIFLEVMHMYAAHVHTLVCTSVYTHVYTHECAHVYAHM